MTHPSTQIPPDEALQIVLQAVQPAAPRAAPLLQAVGFRLAEDVLADRDYPPFDRAMMDGYAVRLDDADGERQVRVAGQLAAGQVATESLMPGQCIEIMTGAVCPEGTEAIVPRELVVREGDTVRLPGRVRLRQHIASRGSECRKGAVALQVGSAITPLAVGVLASVGLHEVRVVPAPKIGVLTTGGELMASDQSPSAAQIRDSNGPMLAAMAISCGVSPPLLLHAADDLPSIVAALEEMGDCDFVVLTGGVSVGQYDLVPESFRQVGAELVFHKVAQKPGKPLLFARRGSQYLFGLPGNPLAAHLCFHRYVAAAIRRWCGHPALVAEQRFGRLVESIRSGGSRTWYVLGRAIYVDDADEGWQLQPLPGCSSADIFGTSEANCYFEVPPGDRILAAGEPVLFEWLGCCSPVSSAPRHQV